MVTALAWGGAESGSAASFVNAYTLKEKPPEIEQRLGAPAWVGKGRSHLVLCYNENTAEEHEDGRYDLCFYFEMPRGDLLSVTRNFAVRQDVDGLFPAEGTREHSTETASGRLEAQSRRLVGDRVLIALGRGKAAEACDQLVIIRQEAVERFFPWVR
jgi:hypothetical protein